MPAAAVVGAGTLEAGVVAAVLAIAAGYLVLRAIRTFARVRGAAGDGGCGCAGTPLCPAANAAREMRAAARRAARKLPRRG